MHHQFPSGFLFGAATSSYQVEGGNHNDWSEWEHANSARLAMEAARRNANAPTRIPDYILNNYPSPLDPENYISGAACDHYHRFREDFDLAKNLGHNAHRFSIEWSRVEPEEGTFDEKEIEHYRDVIHALRSSQSGTLHFPFGLHEKAVYLQKISLNCLRGMLGNLQKR